MGLDIEYRSRFSAWSRLLTRFLQLTRATTICEWSVWRHCNRFFLKTRRRNFPSTNTSPTFALCTRQHSLLVYELRVEALNSTPSYLDAESSNNTVQTTT